MQKARRHIIQDAPTACRRTVSGTVSLPCKGSFSPFPSRYWFTIGLLRVFSLAGWARRIHTGLLVSRATQESATLQAASCKGAVTLYGAAFQSLPLTAFLAMARSYNPDDAETTSVWALPGRSPLLGNHSLFSFSCGY